RASAAPRLLTVSVQVRSCPARTGDGADVCVTDRSASPLIVVFADPKLFFGSGSLVPLPAAVVLLMVVPSGVPGLTWTTMVKPAAAPAPRLASVPLIVPLPPGAGL